MLDMGFQEDIERLIAGLPLQRQTLFFSATMSPGIRALIGRLYFERKYGREWRKMIPVVSSGFFVGAGLVSILSVGFVFLSKAVSTVTY